MINLAVSFLGDSPGYALKPSEQEVLAAFKGARIRKTSRGANTGKLVWRGPNWSSMTEEKIEKYKLFQRVISIIGKHSVPQLNPLEVDLVNWNPTR